MHIIENILKYINDQNLYPMIRTIEGNSSQNIVHIQDKKTRLFCSYNYLGLADHPKIISAIARGLKKYGLSSGGTPLVSGTLDIHKKLEQQVARFTKTEAAMLFTSGAAANASIIPAIADAPQFTFEYFFKKFFFGAHSYILSDELNHATIIDGCRLSKAKVLVYRHKDLHDLEDKLRSVKKTWKTIITDGIFSMDGDIAPLPGIIELARKYNALVMIDDAHATGVLGQSGAGTPEHWGLQGQVDIQASALGKAVGVMGAFVAATHPIIDFLRITARSYIFSASLPGALSVGVSNSISLIEQGQHRRKKLWENADYLRNHLKGFGFDTHLSESPTPIIPVMVHQDKKAIEVAKELFDRGIFAPAIRYPAVAKNTARIRLTVMSTHHKDDLDYLIYSLKELDKKYHLVS